MKFLAAFCLILFSAPVLAEDGSGKPDPSELIGVWNVDLRPTPEAEPYFQKFQVTGIDGRTFSGNFYYTDFENGLLNTDWGVVRFAFTTADGQTPYHHSGKLVAGKLEGMTHAPDRNFLAYWTATRDE